MNRIICYKIQIKKILGLIITCTCLISCEENVIIPMDGKVVSLKEYNRDTDVIVFKADNNGDLFELDADDEAMDKYYFLSKQHIRLYLLSNKDTTNFTIYGIQPIK